MKEVWRNVQILKCPWFFVSNLGRCKTIEHLECCYIKGRYVERIRPGTILKPLVSDRGRQQIGIGKKGLALVHRLVAEAFVPKKKCYDFVIWKDGNRQNNCASNLEWVDKDRLYDMKVKTFVKNHGKPIGAFDHEYDTEPSMVFNTMVEVAKFFGVTKQAVNHWLKSGNTTQRFRGLKYLRYLCSKPPQDNIIYG